MDLKRFGSSPIGHLEPIDGYDGRFDEHYEHAAFVPTPLPQVIDLEAGTYAAVSQAMLALGRLDNAVSTFPRPSLLVPPAIRREAVSTSALEGTYAAFTDVLEADFLEDEKLPANVTEVRNYVRAAEYGVEQVQRQGRPITLNLIKAMHGILMRGTRGDSHETGEFRGNQVLIGPDGCSVTEARFVPPPPGEKLLEGLYDWEGWINAEDPVLPLLARVAAAHYQFETLHPFRDGNGRLGRLVALLQVISEGALSSPVLDISTWLNSRRSVYQDHLAEVSASGRFDDWVTFFAEAVRLQAENEVARVGRLLEEREAIVDRVRAAGIRSVAVQIAENLIGYPVISVRFAADQHGVTYQTANAGIARLEGIGILKNLGNKKYDRLFYSPEVVGLLEQPRSRVAGARDGRPS